MLDGGFTATSAAIFHDCLILSSGFMRVEFEHCQREANLVAHEIVRHSFHNSLSCTWDDDPLVLFYLT